MPAYAILDIDPVKERAVVSNFLGPGFEPIIKIEGTSGHIKINSATDEELQIIAAMINAIGERIREGGNQ